MCGRVDRKSAFAQSSTSCGSLEPASELTHKAPVAVLLHNEAAIGCLGALDSICIRPNGNQRVEVGFSGQDAVAQRFNAAGDSCGIGVDSRRHGSTPLLRLGVGGW